MKAARFAFGLLTPWLAACSTETPTTAIVDNAYPSVPDGASNAGEVTVYKVWYGATLFRFPVAPGGESESERTELGSATAYAVLAPGWAPSSATAPTQFVAVESKAPLSVNRGDTLHIAVSDARFTGRCGGSAPLSQTEADFVTQRIFPAEFAGVHYDAATCRSTAALGDGGTDAAIDTTTQLDGSSDAEPSSDGPPPVIDAGLVQDASPTDAHDAATD